MPIESEKSYEQIPHYPRSTFVPLFKAIYGKLAHRFLHSVVFRMRKEAPMDGMARIEPSTVLHRWPDGLEVGNNRSLAL